MSHAAIQPIVNPKQKPTTIQPMTRFSYRQISAKIFSSVI
jgi:hypothetical protein